MILESARPTFSLRAGLMVSHCACPGIPTRDVRDGRDERDWPSWEDLVDFPLRTWSDHRFIVGRLRALPDVIPPSLLVISQEWGLIDLPLRMSNDAFPIRYTSL